MPCGAEMHAPGHSSPPYPGQTGEDPATGGLIAHSIGLLRWSHHVRQAVVAALRHWPSRAAAATTDTLCITPSATTGRKQTAFVCISLSDGGERALASEWMTVVVGVEGRLRQELGQDRDQCRVIEQRVGVRRIHRIHDVETFPRWWVVDFIGDCSDLFRR